MTIPVSLRFQVLQRDHFTCRYCGKHAPETELEVDHIEPRAKGGSDDIENLVVVCRPCNQGKTDRDVLVPRYWSTLAGKYFHTFCAQRRISRQGMILGEVEPGHYIVRYFSFLSGTPDWGMHIVPLAQMESERWRFYETGDSMREAYDYSGQSHSGDSCECQEPPVRRNGQAAAPNPAEEY